MRTLTPETVRVLMKYNWPGNVRELKNCIEGLVVMSTQATIQLPDLPERILKITEGMNNIISSVPTLHNPDSSYSNGTYLNVEVGMTLDEINREVLRATLEYTENNKVKAAKILDISRRTIQRKAKEYGLYGD